MAQGHRSQWLGWLYRHRYVGLHHAVLAATISALMLAAGKTSAVRTIDLGTRMMLAGVHTLYVGLDPKSFLADPGDRARMIRVQNIALQGGEHNCSPGEFLAEIIRTVADRKPKLLVLDLELAPADGTPLYSHLNAKFVPACRETGIPISVEPDNAEFARVTADAVRYAAVTRHVPVVVRAPRMPISEADYDAHWRNAPLARPAAYDPDELTSALKLDWVYAMCATPGVSMGLMIDFGSASIFAPNKPYLGNVAAHVASGSNLESGGTGDICAALKPVFASRGVMLSNGKIFAHLAETQRFPDIGQAATLSLHYYDTTRQYRDLVWDQGASLADSVAQSLGPNAGHKAVFIGDGNGVHQSLTPWLVDDTDVHAAMFYSDLHPPVTLSILEDLVLEVALGTALGVLFSWTWSFVSEAARRLEGASIHSFGAKARAWGWARLHLLWNLGLLAFVIIGAFILLDEVFAYGTWINPLPVILGMALKGLLNSRRQRHGHAPQSWLELLDMHPDMAWQGVAIAAALLFVGIAP